MDGQNSEVQSLDVQLSPGVGYRKIGKCLEPPNPYHKFLLKLEAAKNTQLGPKLSEKSEQATTAIIRNFLDWYNSLGGVDISIDESTLRHLFRVGFDVPRVEKKSAAAKSMDKVPPRTNPRTEAGSEKQSTFPQKKTRSKTCGSTLKRNENADIIWEGIQDLWSVKAFADWLRRDPSIQVPEYLRECGFTAADEDDGDKLQL